MPGRCGFYRSRSKQLHTTRYHAGAAVLRYRFHPRFGEVVEITGGNRHGKEVVLTIRQLDGTLAQLPKWMMEDGAAAMAVCDMPCPPLAFLRGLRLELDACLKFLRDDSRREGDEHASCATEPSPTRSIRTQQSPRGADRCGADDADATGEHAPDGDDLKHSGDRDGDGQ